MSIIFYEWQRTDILSTQTTSTVLERALASIWYMAQAISVYGHKLSVGALCWSASPNASNNNNAWNVNFNNGNSNNNNKNNNNHVRAVRSGEYNLMSQILPNPPLTKEGASSLIKVLCAYLFLKGGQRGIWGQRLAKKLPLPVGEGRGEGFLKGLWEMQTNHLFKDLYVAWQKARRKKKPSVNQLKFEAHWLEQLSQLQDELSSLQWQPRQYTCFVAHKPKCRQIHAPDFNDRVVHHWLVPQLEAIFEPTFIFDSYSNRVGKGTHVAVQRTQQFIRQVHSGQGGGYYLQCDIYNFFNSIHRATLYDLLKPHIQGLSLPAQHATHRLLAKSPVAYGVHYRGTADSFRHVPYHKRLECAAKGCGLPIGNLSSQFFANVYLNPLDQFVKHELKVKRYVRYVDDFVLIHHDKTQLETWLQQIEQFLQQQLKLSLKASPKLKPLTAGLDFLGYWLYPQHRLVRPRVVGNLRQKLQQTAARHILCAAQQGSFTQQRYTFEGTPVQLKQLQSVWHSYLGHFCHANHGKLQRKFEAHYPWLPQLGLKRRFSSHMMQQKQSIFLSNQPLTQEVKP